MKKSDTDEWIQIQQSPKSSTRQLIDGHIDGHFGACVCGWAYDSLNEQKRIDVVIQIDGEPVGTCTADLYRSDLEDEGVGDGCHAFRFPIPRRYLDGEEHLVEASDSECRVALANSPRTLVLPKTEGFDQIDWREIDPEGYCLIEQSMDLDFYKQQLNGSGTRADDLVLHYMVVGWKEGHDPAPWFSTRFYIDSNRDVAVAGVNPFQHYLSRGKSEGRDPAPASTADADDLAALGARPPLGNGAQAIYAERDRFTAPGPLVEPLDRAITQLRAPKVKALAFYLPQFHAIPENDEWWGEGFTEWRNVTRGQPRFRDHYQPRMPEALGFYDLRSVEVMRVQAALARAAGIHGFCFYYYRFNDRRILEAPIEAFLANRDIDLPFALLWANENWTRTWDGLDQQVLLSQDYRQEDEPGLLADLARHFRDPRYIRIGERPVFFIYRPSLIPSPAETIARWRDALKREHGVDPLMFMAQGFDDFDPTIYGLDGAVEFPPHKVAAGLPAINPRLEILDLEFTGHVMDYDAVVSRSIEEPPPDFPLIKGVTPSWDNEARRPGRGMVLHGSTPRKYERWLTAVAKFAREHPVFGESFVVVNAWNEWAEGAYLEPDLHYGAAYLNATARAVTGTERSAAGAKEKLLLVGHDAYAHGAQMLVRNLADVMVRQFGMEVHILVCGEGPLLEHYRSIAPISTVQRDDEVALSAICGDLADRGFRRAIVNTTVSGWTLRALKDAGIAATSLIHELPKLIRDYALEPYAERIAELADAIVFPAGVVRDGFLSISGPASGTVTVQPQGLYRRDLANLPPDRMRLRRELGIPEDGKVVINVGYADSRKGFDIFARAARAIVAQDDRVYFVWVGGATDDIRRWYLPDAIAGEMADHFFLTGHVDDVAKYYGAADVFLLTSREDPFPSVVLEAFACGLPVVALEDSGGCVDLIRRHGRVVDRHDLQELSGAVLDLVRASAAERQRQARSRKRTVDEAFRFDDYAFSLLRKFGVETPRVSVVVPNYNYARHLPDRMDSIFRQTHPVFEIIVLDDKSNDDSIETLERIAESSGREFSVVRNRRNSGSVFRQWRKGVERARGDYVWIAEADDVADDRFLEQVLGAMIPVGAALGFSDSWQIGPQDERLGDSYKTYVNSVEKGRFDDDFTTPGTEFLKTCLSVKNVILNASSAVWKRSALIDALQAAGDELFDLKVAGDWRLYAEFCRTNLPVAYIARSLNGHRRHGNSVTSALSKHRHYDEVVRVQELVESFVDLGRRQRTRREHHREEVRDALGLTIT